MQVAEVDGVLYAMGGNDGSSSLNSVEVLNHNSFYRDITFCYGTISQNVSGIQFFMISQ